MNHLKDLMEVSMIFVGISTLLWHAFKVEAKVFDAINRTNRKFTEENTELDARLRVHVAETSAEISYLKNRCDELYKKTQKRKQKIHDTDCD